MPLGAARQLGHEDEPRKRNEPCAPSHDEMEDDRRDRGGRSEKQKWIDPTKHQTRNFRSAKNVNSAWSRGVAVLIIA